MKNGYPPIDIKFTDRVEYYKAFDEYHVNNNIGAMENLFARYIKERLDMYLNMLKQNYVYVLIDNYSKIC